MKNSNTQNTPNPPSNSTAGRMPAAVFYTWLAGLLLGVALAANLMMSLETIIDGSSVGAMRILAFYVALLAACFGLVALMRPGVSKGRTLAPALVVFLLIASMSVNSFVASHDGQIVVPGSAIFWVAIYFIVGGALVYQLTFGVNEQVYFDGAKPHPRAPAMHSISVLLAKFGCFILACWVMGLAIGMPATLVHTEIIDPPALMDTWLIFDYYTIRSHVDDDGHLRFEAIVRMFELRKGIPLAFGLFLLMGAVRDQRRIMLLLAAAAHVAAAWAVVKYQTMWWQFFVVALWVGIAAIAALAAIRPNRS